jgi:hypothetical protein
MPQFNRNLIIGIKIIYKNAKLAHRKITNIFVLFSFTILTHQIRIIGHGFNITLTSLPKGSDDADKILPDGSVNLKY